MITRSNEKERTDAKKKEIGNENPFRIFENEKFGKIEVLFKDNQFYFPAIECAKILGYKNPHDAILRHCKNKGVVFHEGVINSAFESTQEILKKYISEGNLYRLIVKSKLPNAIEFEEWIFDIVIPSIRKHGYYSNIPQINEKDAAMLSIIKAGSEEERSIAFSKYQERFVLPMQKELEMARPKVEVYNEFLDAKGTANTTMIAKSFGLSSGRLLNEIMHFEGFIVKIGNGWGPSKRYVDAGIMKPIGFNYNNHKVSVKSAETNDDENKKLISNSSGTLPVPANETAKKAETTELTVIEEENKANHQGKGLTFRWTMNGIETIKEVLLSENYIVKNGNVYSGNNETLKEFKKKYKEWKEKK